MEARREKSSTKMRIVGVMLMKHKAEAMLRRCPSVDGSQWGVFFLHRNEAGTM